MLKRLLGAAVATAAAVGVAALVKVLMDDNSTEENDEENEVRFISIDDAKNEAENAEPAGTDGDDYSKEVNEIAGLYPYLGKDFIAEQFSRNSAFNEQYPEDSLVKITHKAKFESEETMKDFVKIGEDNGYTSEILNETEASICRKLFTEDGSILSDIYNVANQVSCLKGVYEGYNIEL